MQPQKISREIVKAIAVTSQLLNKELSPDSIEVLAKELSQYQEHEVLLSLERCRRELKFFPTISEIISFLPDGRPGVEEAWSMIPRDEYASVVWCDEMRDAFGICLPLFGEDLIAARMAFKERYTAAVSESRRKGLKAKWTPSFGHDKSGREIALKIALEKNRITEREAKTMLPEYFESKNPTGSSGSLTASVTKLLGEVEKKHES